jgi:general secretion pathway protein G
MTNEARHSSLGSRPRAGRLAHVGGFLAAPLLALIFAKTVGAYYGDLDADMKRVVALSTTRAVAGALDRFRSDHQRMPSPPQGLAALVPDYLPSIPLDPWGNPVVYSPSADTRWADVLSYGEDGKPGGAGTAADVSARFGDLGERPPDFLRLMGHGVFFSLATLGLVGAQRSKWATGLLAGGGVLSAVLLLAILRNALRFSYRSFIPLGVALCCLAGSVALLRESRGSRPFTFLAIVAAYVVLEKLIAG